MQDWNELYKEHVRVVFRNSTFDDGLIIEVDEPDDDYPTWGFVIQGKNETYGFGLEEVESLVKIG